MKTLLANEQSIELVNPTEIQDAFIGNTHIGGQCGIEPSTEINDIADHS